jgi:hypothetical protein
MDSEDPARQGHYMTPDEHAAEAERLAARAKSMDATVDDNADPDRVIARMHAIVNLAQVHATLALRQPVPIKSDPTGRQPAMPPIRGGGVTRPTPSRRPPIKPATPPDSPTYLMPPPDTRGHEKDR